MSQNTSTTALVANNLPIPSALGSLDAYISAVHQIPVLTVEDERALAQRYREEEDLDAARELVHSHLRFVVHVARGYNGYGLPLGDLIQEGNIGLMKAVKRFDPEQGVRLVSFAVHWVRARHRPVLESLPTVVACPPVSPSRTSLQRHHCAVKGKSPMDW